MATFTLTRNWTVRRTVLTGFIALILVVTIMNVLTLDRLRTIAAQSDSIERDAVPGIYVLDQIRAASAEHYQLVHDLVLNPDETVRNSIRAQLGAKEAQISSQTNNYAATIFSEGDRMLYEELKSKQAEYLRIAGS